MTAPVTFVQDGPALRVLPVLLSLIAGSVDVIGFLWHATFVAHITGNLILVAARVVNGIPVDLATILSVPVFIVVLGVANTTAVLLEAGSRPTLQLLLGVQAAFLAGFYAAAQTAGTHGPADSAPAVTALMLGVGALATQNALVQTSIRGAPSTAVMTTNLTRFVHDLSEMLLGKDTRSAATRAGRTWPAIAGFGAGAAAGAALYALSGVESLALPLGLALVAVALPGRWADAMAAVPGSVLLGHGRSRRTSPADSLGPRAAECACGNAMRVGFALHGYGTAFLDQMSRALRAYRDNLATARTQGFELLEVTCWGRPCSKRSTATSVWPGTSSTRPSCPACPRLATTCAACSANPSATLASLGRNGIVGPRGRQGGGRGRRWQ